MVTRVRQDPEPPWVPDRSQGAAGVSGAGVPPEEAMGLLAMRDAALERRFWSSGEAASAFLAVDRWAFYLLSLNALSLWRTLLSLVPSGLPPWVAVVNPLLSLLQLCINRWLLARRPGVYCTVRPLLAFAGRFFRLASLSVIACYLSTDSFVSTFLPLADISSGPTLPPGSNSQSAMLHEGSMRRAVDAGPASSTAVVRLCLIGVAITPLFLAQMSLLFPLSFWPNVVLHTASVLWAWRMVAHKMLCVLSQPVLAARMGQWCSLLARVTQALSCLFSDSPLLVGAHRSNGSAGMSCYGAAGSTHAAGSANAAGSTNAVCTCPSSACHEDAPQVLLLWTWVMLGWVLPLALAAAVERSVKLRWLVKQGLRRPEWYGALGWSAYVVLGCALMSGSWAAVEALHPYVFGSSTCEGI